MSQSTGRIARRVAALPVLVSVAVLAAGCGSGSSSNVSPGAAAPSGGTGGARMAPGTSGEIADISGATLQVQNTSGQVAVTYSSTTSFRQQVAATAADVKVGSCVSVMSGGSTTAGTGPIVASQVSITTPTNGSCTGGFGGGAGGFGGGFGNGTRPSGAPGYSRRGTNGTPPSGSPRRFGAFGKVTALTPSGFTVQSTRPAQTGSTASPTTESVTTNASTTYTKTVSATKSALKVGECLTAIGKTDDTGTVAANAITLRAKTASGCTTGGRFGGPGGSSGGATGNEQ